MTAGGWQRGHVLSTGAAVRRTSFSDVSPLHEHCILKRVPVLPTLSRTSMTQSSASETAANLQLISQEKFNSSLVH